MQWDHRFHNTDAYPKAQRVRSLLMGDLYRGLIKSHGAYYPSNGSLTVQLS